MNEEINFCKAEKPVLLQRGYPLVNMIIGVTQRITEQFRLNTDRGFLKHLDVIPIDNAFNNLGQNLPFTLQLGGQNLIQDDQLGFWAVVNQFGRDYKFQIRAKFNDGQIGQITLNGLDPKRPATLDQSAQVIAKYSTPSHERFLKSFKLKYGQGLKRRSYSLIIPATVTPGSVNEINFELPRNNGNIIGIALSNNDAIQSPLFPNNEIMNTFCDVKIDGVNIVENVSMGYYNIENGRDYYLQPVCVNPGSTLTLRTVTPPAITTITQLNCDIYFDN
jgi:hypothetical protein